MKRFLITLLTLSLGLGLFAQKPDSIKHRVYGIDVMLGINAMDVYLDDRIDNMDGGTATNMGTDSTTIETIDGATYEVSWYSGDTLMTYIPYSYRDDGSLTIDVQTGTTYTLDTDDINGPIIYMESASANTVSLPTVATSGWSIGNYLTVTMWGAGTTSIDPVVGVNINGSNDDVDISAQYGMVQIIMVTTNEWHIIGTK